MRNDLIKKRMIRVIVATILSLTLCDYSLGEEFNSVGDRVAQFIWGDGASMPGNHQQVSEYSVEAITGDSTPFLHEWLNGRRVYKTNVTGLRLGDPKAEETGIVLPNVTILVDSATGAMVSVVSRLGELGLDEVGQMTVEYAEGRLLLEGEEYIAFLVDPPRISLARAIRACRINPLSAKLIEALPVRLRYGQSIADTWIISLHGLPPMSTARGPIGNMPIYQKNHIRYIISANSGKLIMASNSPQYPLKDEHNPWKHEMDSIDKVRGD